MGTRARAFTGVAVAAVVLAWTAEASAGVWRWGCAGPAEGGHVVFNRYQMLRLPLDLRGEPLLRVIFLDDMRSDPAIAKIPEANVAALTAEDANSGLMGMLTFLGGDAGETVTLTEKSSKRLSKQVVPGCRDESTTRFRKVYRMTIGTGTARDVTLECYDYTLSTRGGRSCD